MTNQANSSSASADPQGRELVKYSLAPTHPKYSSPNLDHWVLQLHGVAAARIGDPQGVETLILEAVEGLKLTPVSSHTHFFGPGVSTVVILSESHLSAHTWPELGYLHIDLVTCGKQFSSAKLEAVFRGAFDPEYLQLVQLLY